MANLPNGTDLAVTRILYAEALIAEGKDLDKAKKLMKHEIRCERVETRNGNSKPEQNYTRRDFLMSAATGTAVSLLPGGAAPSRANDAGRSRMKIALFSGMFKAFSLQLHFRGSRGEGNQVLEERP